MVHPRFRLDGTSVPLSKPRCEGFTLVETVIAVAIVSFAMLAIFGLLPVGLTTFRQAVDLGVEASIVQRIASDIQRTEFSNLSATNYFFDEQGLALETGAGSNVLFSARVGAPRDLDATNLVDARAAKTVVIQVRNTRKPGETNSYLVLVPRTR